MIVENQSEYAAVVPPEQLTTAIVVEDTPSHCQFSAGELTAAWESLREWVDGSPQPTVEDLQTSCGIQDLGACRFDPSFEVPDMDLRVRPR